MKKIKSIKKLVINIILAILSIFFTILAGEIAIRAYHVSKYVLKGNSKVSAMIIDKKLGWRTKENYVFKGWRKDASGKDYFVEVETNDYGFRIFGDIHSKNKKIMFVGDSFTAALQVSNDKTYCGIIQKKLPVEVFAYGEGGYGTLQEYMILDEYIDMIQPDFIVLQTCSNDFINNSYELELQSYKHNNGLRRPYLMRNYKIFYAIPKRFSSIRNIANNYSKFLYFVLSKIDKLVATKRKEKTVEKHIEEQGEYHSGFKYSAQITNKLIEMFRKRNLKARMFAFCVDDVPPYYEEFRNILKKNGIKFIDSIPQAIREAENKGYVTRASDKAHWNELGHKICAENIINYFAKHINFN